MSKRYVDADILEDLARNVGRARGDLQDLLRRCEGQVSSVPRRGWDQGAWWDVRNTLGSELGLLDGDNRALADRARRVRNAADEGFLQQLRGIWGKATDWLTQRISSEAGSLARLWENFAHSLQQSTLPRPTPRMDPGPGAGIGWLIFLGLTFNWRQALELLHSSDSGRSDVTSTKEQKADQGTRKAAEAGAPKDSGLGAGIAGFKDRYPEKDIGKQVGDEAAYAGTAGCVALVMCYTSEVLHVPLGTYWHGGPNGAWEAFDKPYTRNEAFSPALWQKIPWDQVGKPQIGDIVFFKWDGYGHVAVITNILPDGRIEIMDQAHADHVLWKDGKPSSGVIEASTVDVRIVTPGQGENLFKGVMRPK